MLISTNCSKLQMQQLLAGRNLVEKSKVKALREIFFFGQKGFH